MATIAPLPQPTGTVLDRKLKSRKYRRTRIVTFSVIGIIGTVYVLSKLVSDLSTTHPSTIFPYLLLGLALLIALGFEFVNGFHDTANAVASVIYTHSLDPHVAVVWSGFWNFIGVLTSSGAVAFAIVALLPIELILKVSHGSGFSMVFALLVSAILWNLLTWARGLPASSSHTMIGSILGVAIANQRMHPGSITSAIDWSQVTKIAKALFFSPVVGFTGAFILLWIMKRVITDPELYQAPENDQPPPFWIRCLLICTCGGVSFAHGSNDGQKGMGLIMLILVGTVPTAYALNHTVGPDQLFDFVAVSQQVSDTLGHYIQPNATLPGPGGTPIASARELEHFISSRQYSSDTTLALRDMVIKIQAEAQFSGSLGNVPATEQTTSATRCTWSPKLLACCRSSLPPAACISPKRTNPFLKTIAINSTALPNTSPHGSRSPWRWRWVSERCSAGAASSSRWAKRSAANTSLTARAPARTSSPCSPSWAPQASACRFRQPTSSVPALPAQ